jgi:hypothetical protein
VVASGTTSKNYFLITTTITLVFFRVYGLGHMACSNSEKAYFWNYEPVQTFGRTPWKRYKLNARPLPTQDNTTQHNTTQNNADIHPCPEWDSNSWFQCSSGQNPHFRRRGHCNCNNNNNNNIIVLHVIKSLEIAIEPNKGKHKKELNKDDKTTKDANNPFQILQELQETGT